MSTDSRRTHILRYCCLGLATLLWSPHEAGKGCKHSKQLQREKAKLTGTWDGRQYSTREGDTQEPTDATKQ